ncbi:hypothetical protein IW150_002408 [Coemansia sp. RSA 2607]|nr:hypothetical protein IW150_002408 [Coemansia sp. RSA 2607]
MQLDDWASKWAGVYQYRQRGDWLSMQLDKLAAEQTSGRVTGRVAVRLGMRKCGWTNEQVVRQDTRQLAKRQGAWTSKRMTGHAGAWLGKDRAAGRAVQ